MMEHCGKSQIAIWAKGHRKGPYNKLSKPTHVDCIGLHNRAQMPEYSAELKLWTYTTILIGQDSQ